MFPFPLFSLSCTYVIQIMHARRANDDDQAFMLLLLSWISMAHVEDAGRNQRRQKGKREKVERRLCRRLLLLPLLEKGKQGKFVH